MRIRSRKFNALGDEMAITAVVRELRRQRPNEMIRVEIHRKELMENNPHVNVGITDMGRYELETHWNEDIGSIPQSFAMQIGMNPLADDTPEIHLRPEEKEWGRKKLSDIGASGIVVAVDIRSNWQSRTWPRTNFQAVIDSMPDLCWIEVGYEDNPTPLKNVKASLVSALKIRESAAILSHCALFLGNDSGGFHLAAGCGCPQVVLFGPKKWYSRGYWNTTPVYSFERCAPNCEALCGRRREGHNNELDNWCLGKITPSMVRDKIVVALTRFHGLRKTE